jgi:hypothetical protein
MAAIPDMIVVSDMSVVKRGTGNLTLGISTSLQGEFVQFTAPVNGPVSSPCTSSGACSICIIPDVAPPDMAGITPTHPPDTGPVTFKNGTVTLATLTPSNGVYTSGTQTTGVAMTGDKIHFSSVGNTAAGQVPALSDATLTVPHVITVTAPTANGSATLIKANGIMVTWSGGAAGEKVVLSLTAYKSATTSKFTVITCTLDSSAGTGMVPTTALTDQDTGHLHVNSWSKSVVSVVGFDITEAIYMEPSPAWSYDITTIN